MKKTLLIFFLILINSAVQSQSPDKFLVRFENAALAQHWHEQFAPFIESWECMSSPFQVFRIRLQQNIDTEIWNSMKTRCLAFQMEHYIALHEKIPNDTGFNSQWYLKNLQNPGMDIQAPQAWDSISSVKTPFGKPVVAIVDVGFDSTHLDLKNNWYRNADEIPFNGVDDDSNGYIDDYRGFNAQTNTDEMPRGGHGTFIAGVVGAQGNNLTGICGIGWDLSILPVSIPGQNEGEVIKAFSYIYQERKAWNVSKGQKGAFIVAANASFGFNNTVPEEMPIWCALFDSLGEVGVLTTVSVPNQIMNVDHRRETPSTCGSPFIIAVTSSNERDSLTSFTAFGMRHVALAAPGKGIYTTAVDNDYGYANGNSFAAPMAAAAIAIEYALKDSLSLVSVYNNPSAWAHYFRDQLLNEVNPNGYFKSRVSSGGRLNLFQIVKASGNKILCYSNRRALCGGDTIHLNILNPDPQWKYVWVSNDLNPNRQNGNSYRAVPNKTGPIRVTCYGIKGSDTTFKTMNYAWNVPGLEQKPEIYMDGNGLSASFAKAYQWFDSSGMILGAVSQKYSPPGKGIFRVRCVYESGCDRLSDPFQYFPLEVKDFDNQYYTYWGQENQGFIYKGNTQSWKVFDIQGRLIQQLHKNEIFYPPLNIKGVYIFQDTEGNVYKASF